MILIDYYSFLVEVIIMRIRKNYIRSNMIQHEHDTTQGSDQLHDTFVYEDNFDERYDEKFGEPTTEVFYIHDFINFIDEVIQFE